MSEDKANGISDTMKAMVLYSLHNLEKTSITFRKVDGTERTMLCSLREGVVPSKPEAKDTTTRRSSTGIQVVWDLEAQDWRSFRWDSLKSFKGIGPEEEFTINV